MPGLIELLTEDATDLLMGMFFPSWGIYLNGAPVIQPATPFSISAAPLIDPINTLSSLLGQPNIVPVQASTVDFEYGQDWPISDYPMEQGAFQTYDKVTLPFDVKMRLACGGSPSNRQAFLQTCFAIANSFALFDIVTPEMTFVSINCEHIAFRRSARRGLTLIVVELWFRYISVTGQVAFSNTSQPGESGQQSVGNVQAQPTTSAVDQSLVEGSIY